MGDVTKPVIAVEARTDAFAEHLSSLALHATLVSLTCADAATDKPAAIILSIDEADEESFRTLGRLRHEQPTVPIVAVARCLEANLAVELVKLGVTDCMCLPSPPGTLWRKVERAMLHSGGPTIDSALIGLLWNGDRFPAHEEKRRCFRSNTAADYPAYVTVVSPSNLPKMLVKDLSILTEGCPGGFALVGQNAHVHAMEKNPSFRFVLEVPDYPRPIPGKATVKRVMVMPRPGDPTCVIGVEYLIDQTSQETIVRRFWSESQRRIAAIARSAAGAI